MIEPSTLPHRFLCTISLCLLLVLGLSAQNRYAKWGKLSDAELAMSSYEADSNAAAVVLADQGYISFVLVDGVRYRFFRHCRIKILKEAGFKHTDVNIPFYSAKNEERLVSLKAQIFSPDGQKQTVSKKAIFTEQLSDEWSARKFSFPNVEVGSIIEYRYEIVSKRFVKLRDWYFQQDIPVVYSELKLDIPKWFEYVYLFQGGENKIRRERDDGSFVLESKAGGTLLEGDAKVQLESDRIIMENVPALREAPYITTMEDYLAKLQLQLRRIQYPNGDVELFMDTWEVLADNLKKHSSFGQQYRKGKFSQRLVSIARNQIKDADSPREKIDKLYYFLAKQVKWNGDYSPYVRSSLDEAFENGEANSGELNLMLLALLRQLTDIEAYPMMISTRSHGKVIKQYPIIDQFNHVIVRAVLEEGPLLLDVGDELRPPGFPRIESLNNFGWQVSEEPEWRTVIAAKGADVLMVDCELAANGTISGRIEGRYMGYEAINEHQAFMTETAKSRWMDRLTEKFPDAQIDSISFVPGREEGKPFKMNVFFQLPNAAQVNEGLIYVDPIIYSLFDQSIHPAALRRFGHKGLMLI
ncbi:MAG: DUF3857 domain-containing protein, partial [Bacteroidota bacterium]